MSLPTTIGRASTPAEKRAVIERIHAAWCAVPGMRLGELIASSCHEADCYYSVDTTLAELCETLAREHTR